MKWIEQWIEFNAPIELEDHKQLYQLKRTLRIYFRIENARPHEGVSIMQLFKHNLLFSDAYYFIKRKIEEEQKIRQGYV